MEQEKKSTRLNKFLAERLGMSRREADDIIRAGKVMVNGQTAEPGNRVDENDKICYNNKPVPHEVKYVYYALNKPVGYVCSRNKQGKDPTIYELLPKEMNSFKNVGRLDRMSSGLLLLTNDGDFAYQMTFPGFYKQKVYEVTLHKPLTEEDRRKITEEGVEISDGLSKFEAKYNLHPPHSDTPAKQLKAMKKSHIRLDSDQPDGMHVIVTLTEGRNRQIRRTFAALGYNVLTLHRTKFGKYELGDLKPGEVVAIEK